LLALPGQRLEHIRQVISHPQVLMQCDVYLEHLGVELIVASDTAGSARLIREQELRGVAAIASALAAEHHRLAILAEDIQVRSDNATCFVILCSAQVFLREEYALLCQLKTARARGWHDQAERLTHALTLRNRSAEWEMRYAS
jgi:prephenate dehydratase